MLDRIKKRHIALLILLAIGAAFTIFYFNSDQPKDPVSVRSYEKKDFQPVLKIMNDNKFWISEHADLSGEKVLTFKAPNNDMSKKGQASIDVVAVNDEAVGFIAYYRKSFLEGRIWLLAIDKDSRKKGFGERLIDHALMELKKKGATYVTLAAKTINKPAISLYQKMGFVEENRDENRGIVFLIRHQL